MVTRKSRMKPPFPAAFFFVFTLPAQQHNPSYTHWKNIACSQKKSYIGGITRNTTAMKKVPRLVIDTNVIVSGLRSTEGASYLLLSHIETMPWKMCVSSALLLEYEEQLLNDQSVSLLSDAAIQDFLDIIADRSEHVQIFYRWRPQLKDPDDDMVLETAVNGTATHIVTYNLRDFRNVERFGLKACTPKDFLITEKIVKGT